MGITLNPFTGQFDITGDDAGSSTPIVSGTTPVTGMPDNAILYNNGGVVGGAGPLDDGELLIGTTGSDPVAANITSPGTITITNGPGTIDIEVANGLNANKIADGSVSNAEFQFINSVTSNVQTQLDNKQPLDATLTALAAYNTNGLITQTAADTFTGRSIIGTANQVIVTNGNGVAGNPTLALPQDIATTSTPTFNQITINNPPVAATDVATKDYVDITFIPLTQKGAANGVASLDGGGKVPIAQLPSSIMEYKGVWNASTNTPTLADGTGDTGDVYRVGTAGTQDLGSGPITFNVGDYVIYNGTTWEKSDTTDAVASVNGFTGIVVLDTDDIAEGATNLYYTNARVDAAVAGAANTFAGYDNTGDLDSVPGWNFTDTATSYQTQVNPTLAGTVTDFLGLNLIPTMDGQALNSAQGLRVNMSFGPTVSTTANGTNGLDINNTYGPSVDVNNANGLSISDNLENGSIVDGYTGIFLNQNVATTMSGGWRQIQTGASVGQTDPASIANWQDVVINPKFFVNATLNGDYMGAFIGGDFEPGMTMNGNIQTLRVSPEVDTDVNSMTTFSAGTNIGSGGSNTTVTSYQEANFNTNFGADATIGDYSGLIIRPNAQVGSIITGSVTMIDLAINANISVGNDVKGINVDLSNFISDEQKIGLSITDGALSVGSNIDTSVITVDPVFQNNSIGGLFTIASGFPVAGSFGFGNNIGTLVIANDDMDPDNTLGTSSLGYSINGLVNQVSVATGKTVDTLQHMLAGGSFPATSTGGTITNYATYRAIGLINAGGTLVVDNAIQFHADEAVDGGAPTNLWAFRADSTTAENFMAKSLAIGTASKKVSAAGIGLEVNAKDILIDQGELSIANATNTVSIAASASMATDYTLTLPVDDGASGQVLSTNGTGVLSWINNSTGNAGDIPETIFVGADNQTNANITGLNFANGVTRSFDATIQVVIIATGNLYEVFNIRGIQRDADWTITVTSTGDTSGTSFNITNAGQIQYSQGAIAGLTSLTMTFKADTLGV